MVILGGSGNNLGAIVGALLVYVIWTLSEPAALLLFEALRDLGDAWFGWEPPSDLQSRALQMRVFVIGLTITLVLRFAPRGVLPERVPKHEVGRSAVSPVSGRDARVPVFDSPRSARSSKLS